MAERDFDVIIAGGGPAGATLGYELARQGASVLILEKQPVPRYKPCGGGLTKRAANLLEFDLSPVIEQAVYNISPTYQFRPKGTRQSSQPLLCTVMRSQFDSFLIQQAETAGARILDNCPVKTIDVAKNRITVHTRDGDFIAKTIVGADGYPGTIARQAGLHKSVTPFAIGFEAEVSVPQDILELWHNRVGIDLGTIPGGYGWVFPKQDHLSVGVCGPVKHGRQLKSYYLKFLQSHRLQDHPKKFYSHSISFRKAGYPIQHGPILLVGDAAGLCDPLTGEGIYYAIRSARLAAPVISEFLNGNLPDLTEYERETDRVIMPDLQIAGQALKILEVAPRFGLELVMKDKRVWDISCQVLCGEKSYRELKQELTGFPAFKIALRIWKGIQLVKS